MNRWHWLALLFITSLALALRLPDLGRRPLHNDEAVNAFKLRDLWLKGEYRYNPDEFHGPSLHYGSLPFVWLSGARDFNGLTEARLRLVTVAAGLALVLLSLLFAAEIGLPTALVAAFLLAISPAMVFYSRNFIHEMVLVSSTGLAIGAGWRWWNSGKVFWAILSGIGLGLMYATKETFIFSIVAALLASVQVMALQRLAASSRFAEAPKGGSVSCGQRRMRGVVWLVIAAAVVSIPLFTSLFANWDGLLDSFQTYFIWLKRAGGASPHIHGWSFYLERLLWFHQPKGRVWSEGLILLLALFGAVAGLSGRGVAPPGVWLVRWLTGYSVALTGIYCLVPYKTPWCLLGFYHGWILLAGVGAVAIWEWLRNAAARVVYVVVLGGAAGCLTWQSWLASFEYSSSRQNPYVYSQTVPQVRELTQRVEGIARLHPSGQKMAVVVISPDSYWPLPYYLRAFPNVGWWDSFPPPTETFAPVILASARLHAVLDEKSDRRWLMAGLYELRPGTFLELYVELELWKRYVATLPRPSD